MIRFLFVFALCYCTSAYANAQTSRFDSLNALLPATQGNERFDVLYQMIREVFKEDMELALCFADEAIGIIPEFSDSMRIGKAYRVKGHLLFIDGRVSDALPFQYTANHICRSAKNASELTYILNLLGLAYTFNGEYGGALKCFLEAIELRRTSGGIGLGILYSNLGLVYYKLHNFEKAIAYYNLSLMSEAESSLENVLPLINKGLAFCQQEKFCEAIEYINYGLSLCKHDCENGIINGEFALGLAEFMQGNSLAAERHFNKSLEFSRKNNEPRFELENLLHLARIKIECNHYEDAYSILEESQRISGMHSFNELLIDVYRTSILLFERQHNWTRLGLCYMKFNELREKLHGREVLQQMVVVEAELEHQENSRIISYQNDLMEVQGEALRLERRIQLAIVFLILIVGMILFLLYKSVLQKRKINALLAIRVTQRKAELATAVQGLKNKRVNVQQMVYAAMEVCHALTDFSRIQTAKVNGDGSLARMIQLSIFDLSRLSCNAGQTMKNL